MIALLIEDPPAGTRPSPRWSMSAQALASEMPARKLRTYALGAAVGNDILGALTWAAAVTMVYGATCRFACACR